LKQIHDLFLIQCKKNYFDEIFPADPAIKQSKGYLKLKDLAQSYFSENKYGEFEGFFMESQYLIQLWAAHLIIEHGNPTEELKTKCLQEIAKYSTNPISPKIAAQEADWLKHYYNRK